MATVSLKERRIIAVEDSEYVKELNRKWRRLSKRFPEMDEKFSTRFWDHSGKSEVERDPWNDWEHQGYLRNVGEDIAWYQKIEKQEDYKIRMQEALKEGDELALKDPKVWDKYPGHWILTEGGDHRGEIVALLEKENPEDYYLGLLEEMVGIFR